MIMHNDDMITFLIIFFNIRDVTVYHLLLHSGTSLRLLDSLDGRGRILRTPCTASVQLISHQKI